MATQAKVKSAKFRQCREEFRIAFFMGYKDYRESPDTWSELYEVMNESEQLGYEQGRLLACGINTVQGNVPLWRGSVADMPQPIAVAFYNARQQLGDLWTN